MHTLTPWSHGGIDRVNVKAEVHWAVTQSLLESLGQSLSPHVVDVVSGEGLEADGLVVDQILH